jgi:hypothetical protein
MNGLLAPVTFPQLMKLDTWTPDGRFISAEGFGTRNLPVPIMLLDSTGPGGHQGAKVAGRLDEVVVGDDGIVSGKGWLIDNEEGRKAHLLLSTKAVKGNSVDLADVNHEMTNFTDEFGVEKAGVKFKRAKIGMTTIVPLPAFPEATVELDGTPLEASFATTSIEFGTAVLPEIHTTDVSATWFSSGMPRKPYPLTIESNGRVHGYLATWATNHLSTSGRVKPPRGKGYRYFNTSTVLTNDGPVSTGPLVLGGDHASVNLGWTDAADHYAATSLAWADVHVTDDRHGIRVNGMVRPGTPPEAIHAARASRLSGDWRRIDGHMELIAALSVNAPGFPIGRDFSANGQTDTMILMTPDRFEPSETDLELEKLRLRLALSQLPR